MPAGSAGAGTEVAAAACRGCSASRFSISTYRTADQLDGACAARAAISNGVSAESQLLDPELLQLLRGVQAGEVSPEAATLHLRERTAGYEQARSCNEH